MSILNFFTNRNNTGTERFVLCIDGGGMRGVVPVIVLQKLEKYMKEAGAEKPLQSYFDLIAGTSTGGLIAACLSFPVVMDFIDFPDAGQIDLKVLENVYMNIGTTIFPKGNLIQSIVNVPYQVVGDKYPVDGLENVLKQWFKNKKLSDAAVPTLLMTYNLTQGRGELLTSYGSSDISVVQACRATSAAPTYFAPLEYKGNLYADGGLIANNPSLYAYREIKRLYPDCRKVHILSLGTAADVHRTETGTTSGLVNWIEQLLPIYQTAQKNSVDGIMNELPDVDYLRIEKEYPESIRLDDTRPGSLQDLNRFGKALSKEYEESLKTFASNLVG